MRKGIYSISSRSDNLLGPVVYVHRMKSGKRHQLKNDWGVLGNIRYPPLNLFALTIGNSLFNATKDGDKILDLREKILHSWRINTQAGLPCNCDFYRACQLLCLQCRFYAPNESR